MCAKIKKIQIFHEIKYNLKGHWGSQKVIFMFNTSLILRCNLCLKSDLIQILYECYHDKDIFFSWYDVWPQMSLKLTKGHFLISWKGFIIFILRNFIMIIAYVFTDNFYPVLLSSIENMVLDKFIENNSNIRFFHKTWNFKYKKKYLRYIFKIHNYDMFFLAQ